MQQSSPTALLCTHFLEGMSNNTINNYDNEEDANSNLTKNV